MTSESLQPILRELFGESAGAAEAVMETDRGAVWAFALRVGFGRVWDEGALDIWNRLHGALAPHDLWPLIGGKRGEEEDVRVFASGYAHNIDRASHRIEAVLAHGLALDLDAWLQQQDARAAQWRAEHEAYLASSQHQADLQAQREYEELEAIEDAEFFDENSFADEPQPEGSPWREDEPQVLAAPQPQETWFLLVPASQGWEVPAVVCFGGWNACPEPHEHVALIHEWNQKYSAQLIGLSHDSMLFHAARPPRSNEDALLLGRQQFYFCSGDGWPDDATPESLAIGLVNRGSWWFWWD